MENKIIGLFIISIVLGAGIGFGTSYMMFQPQIQNLESTLSKINNRVWHKVYSTLTPSGLNGSEMTTLFSGANGTIQTIPFEIKGNSVRLRWFMGGTSSGDMLVISLQYANSTELSGIACSGVYSSDTSEIQILEPS